MNEITTAVMQLTWRQFAQTTLFIISMLALLYAAMTSSSPELVSYPRLKTQTAISADLV